MKSIHIFLQVARTHKQSSCFRHGKCIQNESFYYIMLHIGGRESQISDIWVSMFIHSIIVFNCLFMWNNYPSVFMRHCLEGYFLMLLYKLHTFQVKVNTLTFHFYNYVFKIITQTKVIFSNVLLLPHGAVVAKCVCLCA